MDKINQILNRIENTAHNLPKLEQILHRVDSVVSRVDAQWSEEKVKRAKDGKFAKVREAKSSGNLKRAEPEKKEKAKEEVLKKEDKIDKKSPVYKAVKDKPFTERYFHLTNKAWDDAPQFVVDAIAKTKGVEKVMSNTNWAGSSYNTREHAIFMAQEADPKDKNAVLVWRHEYGHAIDGNGEGNNKDDRPNLASAKYINAMLYDTAFDTLPDTSTEEAMKKWKRAKQAELRITKNYYDTYIEFRKESDDPEDYGILEGLLLSDFVAALTMCKHGYGHSKEYFAKGNEYRVCEMFANYVALISGKNGEKYRKALHNIAPTSCRGFDDILLERAGYKWGSEKYKEAIKVL